MVRLSLHVEDAELVACDTEVYSSHLWDVSQQTAMGCVPWLLLRYQHSAPPTASLRVLGLGSGLLAFMFSPAYARVGCSAMLGATAPVAVETAAETAAAAAVPAAGVAVAAMPAAAPAADGATTAWACLFPRV